jgi:ribonuclease E
VPNEIAIYVLNQKRHELARLESEHRMEITFVPQDNLPAGQFEIERLKGRDPGEKPRHHAVGIEAGFVHSDEPEPDYVEEAEEEEEIEETDAVDSEAGEADQGEETQRGERSGERNGDREGGRDGKRRRRRGGRGRNRRERGDGEPREQQPQRDAQPRAEGEAADGEAGEMAEGAEAASPNGETGQQQAGEGGRRRRRRRGRRGGRDREDRPHDQGNPFPDRFGAPDEIDTTPGTGPAANAPSAPVWSLSSEPDEVDTTPVAEDNKPKKKGWWQKTFGGGEE